MHGNVFEWCVDPWHPDYSGDPPNNYMPWMKDGDFSSRVVRGGSWLNRPVILRSAHRDWGTPTYRLSDIGFRLARTVFTA